MVLRANLTMVTEIRRHMSGEGGRKTWPRGEEEQRARQEIDKWETIAAEQIENTKERNKILDTVGRPPRVWRTLAAREYREVCKEDARKLKEKLTWSSRVQARQEINEAISNRESMEETQS